MELVHVNLHRHDGVADILSHRHFEQKAHGVYVVETNPDCVDFARRHEFGHKVGFESSVSFHVDGAEQVRERARRHFIVYFRGAHHGECGVDNNTCLCVEDGCADVVLVASCCHDQHRQCGHYPIYEFKQF